MIKNELQEKKVREQLFHEMLEAWRNNAWTEYRNFIDEFYNQKDLRILDHEKFAKAREAAARSKAIDDVIAAFERQIMFPVFYKEEER